MAEAASLLKSYLSPVAPKEE